MDRDALAEENAHLRQLLVEERARTQTLRTSLQELVDRRKRVSREYNAEGIPVLDVGSDGRYARAEAALEAAK
jgi:hypothetical protein